MAQICADTLGVDYRKIRVIHGRTDLIAHGIGAHSSRASVMTGSATHVAATKVRRKALGVASGLLQTPAAELEVVDGVVVRKGGSGPSVSLAEIARTIAPTSKARGEHEPGLSAEGWFFTDHMVYPYGIHIAVAKVDRETGEVEIERYIVAYDLGRAINPMMVEGQIAGGVAQGMGGALFEEFSYDDRGEPLSLTFADYLIPTCAEMPPVEVLIAEDAPSPRNPLGIKGAGEAGTNAAGAAIAAAIDDAIGMPGAITALPVTPQRLKEILARQRSPG
jgi:CO/xanthine dehydrogenase Mo-binding subunit